MHRNASRGLEGALRWLVVALAASMLSTTFVVAQTGNPPASGSQDAPSSAEKQDHGTVDPGMTKLKLLVMSDTERPVANASVYVRYYEPGGFLRHEKLAELNFKTNQDGSVKVPQIPQGKVLIQVIATGWHTYGKWYDVGKDEEAITIKLAPPPHWY
jgi:hypothetical protein